MISDSGLLVIEQVEDYNTNEDEVMNEYDSSMKEKGTKYYRIAITYAVKTK